MIQSLNALNDSIIPIIPMVHAAPQATCLVAMIGGTPAAAGAMGLFPEYGLAAMFGAATLPEFRGRGLQSALFQLRLALARDAGCDLAVTLANAGTTSQRNAERAGFRVGYPKTVVVQPEPEG